MNKLQFQLLLEKHEILSSVYFSQYHFKETHLPQFKWNLCAALVNLWSKYKKANLDFFAFLNIASVSDLQHICKLQANSIYPMFFSEVAFNSLTQESKNLLMKKYGSYDFERLSAMLSANGVQDFLEYDIQLAYSSTILDRSFYNQFSELLIQDLLSPRKGVNFALIILRYSKLQLSKTKIYGHRVGIYYSENSLVTFFDPDIGEVQVPFSDQCLNWLYEYWNLSKYSKGCSIEKIPFISVYYLGSSPKLTVP